MDWKLPHGLLLGAFGEIPEVPQHGPVLVGFELAVAVGIPTLQQPLEGRQCRRRDFFLGDGTVLIGVELHEELAELRRRPARRLG
jgi:hypothetical protein